MAKYDVIAGRLAEAHADAVAILAELDGPHRSRPVWGVWAAEAPDAVLSARAVDDGVRLAAPRSGVRVRACVTHALVTAQLPAGERGLFAVDVGAPGCGRCPAPGATPGMADS